MKRKVKVRYIILGILLLYVWFTQWSPALGAFYSETLYPRISFCLSFFSNCFPFALGDLFIFLSIVGIIAYPIYGRVKKKKIPWKKLLLRDVEYLAWVYVWFYIAWGLNYSQPNFYQRTKIPHVPYTQDNFNEFLNAYIDSLNSSYVFINGIHEEQVRSESVRIYDQLSDSLGIHRPPFSNPRVKTMLFTPFISMVSVTGSMGPFFNEFTLNGDLLPANYPATYAHELAHLLGISSEAEANFYAYQVCTRSDVKGIRFSGYFSIFYHVLNNAYRLLDEEEYKAAISKIRPEVIGLANANRAYWVEKYSPVVGDVQDWIYDLYLKGNKIESGKKNYSEVIGLLISYQNRPK